MRDVVKLCLRQLVPAALGLRQLMPAALGMCAATVLGASEIRLPDIGDSGAGAMSPIEEQQIGEAVVRNIRRAGGVIDDPLLVQYINHMGYQLIAARREQTREFNFFVVNDGGINAFALPGGYIGINYGLFQAFDTENELAAVVAHEIAHVTQRHHARAYEMQSGSNLPVLAAMIAAMLLGAGDIGQAAAASVAAGSIQHQLDFTRGNEMEADRIGISLLADAGYDPHSMASTFERMAREARLYGPQLPEFLRTHPVSETRIAEARSRADRYQPRRSTPRPSYFLMRARLAVLTSRDIDATVKRFRKNLTNHSYMNRDAEGYGYALALLQAKKPAEARPEVERLREKEPNRIAYQILHAQLEMLDSKPDQAQRIYEDALALSPGNPTLTYYYAETLIDSGKPRKANALLKDFLRAPPSQPAFYRLLSETESQLGNLANAHEALAEYYYNVGQTHQAITQLTLARQAKSMDFYQSARIEARLAQFKDELALLSKK
ncbi:MAG: M48 family metallopeptidase [Pseudomonadota bacterium]|nr:MAG: M48 family metallopeptidase [Pseudomonadota bacterium]